MFENNILVQWNKLSNPTHMNTNRKESSLSSSLYPSSLSIIVVDSLSLASKVRPEGEILLVGTVGNAAIWKFLICTRFLDSVKKLKDDFTTNLVIKNEDIGK